MKYYCPYCGIRIKKDQKSCKYCGYQFRKLESDYNDVYSDDIDSKEDSVINENNSKKNIQFTEIIYYLLIAIVIILMIMILSFIIYNTLLITGHHL